MKIYVSGNSIGVQELKTLFRSGGYAVSESNGTYTFKLDSIVSQVCNFCKHESGPVDYIVVDSIDSELERLALSYIEELGVPKFMIHRANGNRSERRLEIQLPDKFSSEVALGIYRAVDKMLNKSPIPTPDPIRKRRFFGLLPLLLAALIPSISFAQDQNSIIRFWNPTLDQIVAAGDVSNNALRVNIVAGAGGGGTSSNFGSAFPSSGTASGFSDGTNMQGGRVFDLDTGGGTQYVLGVSLRLSGSGGSGEIGSSAAPMVVSTGSLSGGISFALTTTGQSAATTDAFMKGSLVIEIVGTWTGTLSFEIQPFPAGAYYSTSVMNQSTGAFVTSTTANGVFYIHAGTWNSFRVYATSIGSGTATVNLRSDTGSSVISLSRPLPAGTNLIGGVNLAQLGGTTLSGANVVDAGNTAFRVNCVTGCAGSSFADSSAFSFGSTTVSNTAFVVDDTGTNTVAENSSGAARMNTNRILYADLSKTTANTTALLVTGTGGTFPVTGTFWQTTQPISIDQTGNNNAVDVLTMPTVTVTDGAGAMNVIVDSGSITASDPTFTDATGTTVPANAAFVAGTDGTNTRALKTDTAGELQVDVLTVPTVTVTDGAGAMNVIVDSGTTTVTQATGSNLHVVVDTAPTTTVTATNLDVQIGGTDSLTIGTFPDNEPFNQNQRGGVAVVAGACERETLLYVQISQTSGTQLITGTASERIYICSIQLVTATAQNVALVDGTGTVCGTSPTGLLGGSTAATGWNFAANGGIVLPQTSGSWAKTSTDADNVCLLQSGSGQISGSLTYISIPNI